MSIEQPRLNKMETNSKKLFDLYNSNLTQTENLGKIIETYNSEFGVSDQTTKMFKNGSKVYPDKIKLALIQIVNQYNSIFSNLVSCSIVNQGEYQYCDGKTNPTSLGVQIDMVALPDQILEYCQQPEISIDDIADFLKGVIFEIENSLASYTFLGAMSPKFKQSLKSTIQSYRQKTNRDIYLLATSQSKFESIATGEFGKEPNSLYDQKVYQESGFDGVISPQEFELMVRNGEELPLFFTRSSLDTSVLRNTKNQRPSTLLDNPNYVKIIRKNSITPNVDYPNGQVKTNDTKAYMEKMNLGYDVNSLKDIFENQAIINFEKKPQLILNLNKRFRQFCELKNINLDDLVQGKIKLRAKPMLESYGCYGHIRSNFGQSFINKLSKEIEARGTYIIQPELQNLKVTNTFDNQEYINIDRNFILINNQGEYEFVAGFRSNMPVESTEAKKNNIHGNDQTIYTLIK